MTKSNEGEQPPREDEGGKASTHMKYRPEVDGLRALAVLPVILFHAGYEPFSGGFIGVDVFFVISGYLITTIIHRELAAGTFSIVNFYERRVRRILPVLYFVIAVCVPFAWLWLSPSEFIDFGQSIVAVNVFSSNILFWRESGYFEAAAELKPLLHTWSLAVEEQFYVVFPLLLMAFHRLGRRVLVGLVALICLASLGLSEWGATAQPDANFYLLPFRAWELGVGALLALSVTWWRQAGARTASLLAGVGLLAVLVSIVMFDGSIPFPSAVGLVPVLGTALVIAFGRPENLVGRVLSWRPMVQVGLISYSAYLWHQPMFAFARIRALEGVTPSMYLGLSLAALGLAYLSWRFIEQPFRNKRRFSRTYMFVSAGAGSLVLCVFGVSGETLDGVPQRLDPSAVQMANWKDDISPKRKTCHASNTNRLTPSDACVFGEGKGQPLVVWGDSHGVELAWQLSKSLEPFETPIKQLTFTACPPVSGVTWLGHRSSARCARFTSDVEAHLASEPRTVLVVARWASWTEAETFDNHEGGEEAAPPGFESAAVLPKGKGRAFLNDPQRIDAVGAEYRKTIEALLARGHRVVLVHSIPEAGWNVPLRLARELWMGVPRSEALSTSYEVYKARTRNSRAQLEKLGDHENLLRVYPEEVFCDVDLPGRCVVQSEGRPLYFDDDHLNNVGASMLAEHIVEKLKGRGWLRRTL